MEGSGALWGVMLGYEGCRWLRDAAGVIGGLGQSCSHDSAQKKGSSLTLANNG